LRTKQKKNVDYVSSPLVERLQQGVSYPNPDVSPAYSNAIKALAVFYDVVVEEEIDSGKQGYRSKYCEKEPMASLAKQDSLKSMMPARSFSPHFVVDSATNKVSPCAEKDVWLGLTNTKL